MVGMAGATTLSPMLRQNDLLEQPPRISFALLLPLFPRFPQMMSVHFLSILPSLQQGTRQNPVADGVIKMLRVHGSFYAVFKWNRLVTLGKHIVLQWFCVQVYMCESCKPSLSAQCWQGMH